MVSFPLLKRSVPIPVLITPLVPAEILSQSCVCPPNWTKFVDTELALLSVTMGQEFPAPGVAITGPLGPSPKQINPVVTASPSNWKTPLESSTPPPGLLNCANAACGSPKTTRAIASSAKTNESFLQQHVRELITFLLLRRNWVWAGC